MTCKHDKQYACSFDCYEKDNVKNDKYKPFNLERALAGDKFARKQDMQEPLEWKHLPETKWIAAIFLGMNDTGKEYHQEPRYFDEDGNNFGWTENLVMLPKTKKLWIAVSIEKFESHYNGLCHNVYGAYEDLNYIKRNFPESTYQHIQIEVEE